MPIHEVRVGMRGEDRRGEAIKYEAENSLGITGIESVRTSTVYRLEGTTAAGAEQLATKLLAEPIDQEYAIDEPLLTGIPMIVEVAYLPGVMNPQVASVMDAARDIGVELEAADTGIEYGFFGDLTEGDIERIVDGLLVNKTVQRVITDPPETLIIAGETGPVETIPLRTASADELVALSKDRLFLDLGEMQTIREYFSGLERDPTDCELEIIAARWSEHCGHKTFKSPVVIDGVEKPPLFSRIAETARKYFGDEVVSAFKDNSGVMRFYEGQAICGKVETHNSPSAIEPYGGAATGVGGVLRDILGTGQGADPVIVTDMFCFAPPDLDPARLPPGTLTPDRLQRGVVQGVRDYGNRVGIPTNNGSVHYDKDFRVKPTVIVGAYGILPEDQAQKGVPEIGDLVVVLGGRTGRDGIHGATFSSGEMTERTMTVHASAVQIGNPIEEKRMLDAIISARDRKLIRAITDCGAAGFSSAIGEMGEDIGVTVDLRNAPLKYPGLAPWEIFLSESQERMVSAIAPEHLEEFLSLCHIHNVETAVLGNFDGSNRLTVTYGEQIVADLDYDFLNSGYPERKKYGTYEKPIVAEEEVLPPTDWNETVKKLLSHGNVASKEPIVRQYDHTVQGTNVIPPFSGVRFDGPNDAAVIMPMLGKPYGMVVAHGMNPCLNRIDPYWGSVWATAEAMANYVAVGGNPEEAALINNYIWPYPDETAMGSLDRSVDAVVDCMDALKRPVISGKDSLSSTYRGPDGEIITIPPVLCMSVFGRIPDVAQTVTSDIKSPGSTLVLVGAMDPEMGGSTYYDLHGLTGNGVPKVDLELLPEVLRGVHAAMQTGEVLSCHDVSHGGIMAAVSEMAFGGDCGVELALEDDTSRSDFFLFNETAGMFVIEVSETETATRLFEGLPFQVLGKTTAEKHISVRQKDDELFTLPTDELRGAWQEPMRREFP